MPLITKRRNVMSEIFMKFAAGLKRRHAEIENAIRCHERSDDHQDGKGYSHYS